MNTNIAFTILNSSSASTGSSVKKIIRWQADSLVQNPCLDRLLDRVTYASSPLKSPGSIKTPVAAPLVKLPAGGTVACRRR